VTEGTKSIWLQQLRAQKADPRDLAEMAQRILHTRESRTVPPLAEILRRLGEARMDRVRGAEESPRTVSGKPGRLSVREVEEVRVWRNLASLGVHHCDVRGWQTGGYCGCKRLCWGEGVSAEEAREKLAWAEREGIALPVKQAVGSLRPVAEAVDEIPF